jgi:hypothetical protein
MVPELDVQSLMRSLEDALDQIRAATTDRPTANPETRRDGGSGASDEPHGKHSVTAELTVFKGSKRIERQKGSAARRACERSG